MTQSIWNIWPSSSLLWNWHVPPSSAPDCLFVLSLCVPITLYMTRPPLFASQLLLNPEVPLEYLYSSYLIPLLCLLSASSPLFNIDKLLLRRTTCDLSSLCPFSGQVCPSPWRPSASLQSLYPDMQTNAQRLLSSSLQGCTVRQKAEEVLSWRKGGTAFNMLLKLKAWDMFFNFLQLEFVKDGHFK